MSTVVAPLRSIIRTVTLTALALVALAADAAVADDGADGGCGSVTITQSIGTVVFPDSSAWCEIGFVQTVNAYMRAFNLPAEGVSTPFHVCGVRIGVEFAAHPSGTQTIGVNIYELDGPLLLENLTLLESELVDIPNLGSTTLTVPMSVDLLAGTTFVLEVFTQAAPSAGFGFFMGTNPAGQTAPSYLVAPACGVTQPTDTAALGAPAAQWLMWVDGDPLPTGSCCFFDGTCGGGFIQSHCEAAGGLFAASQSCAAAPCVELCGTTSLTQNTAQAANGVSSFACAPGGVQSDNSYFRIFDLAAEGITTTFEVCEVQFGVQFAVGPGGTQPVTVNVYTLDGAFTFANLTEVGTATVDVADSGPTMVTVPVAASVPGGSQIVVEVFSAASSTAEFRIGSNEAGQTAPCYWAAPACSQPEPVDLATLGVPTINWIINLSGGILDLDGDGVPDSLDNCVLYNPDQRDCDGNGIGDTCDIGVGEPDCNDDGVPDACQGDPIDGFALTFDGDDDAGLADTPPQWSGNTSFTVEFWVRYRPQPSRTWIMDIGVQQAYGELYCLVNEAGDAQFGLWNGTLNTFGFAAYADEWAHVATVYDASANTLTNYVNGEFAATTPVAGTVNLAPGANQLRIGVPSFGESPLRGDLDEVRIWNIARSEAEIEADLFQTITGTETGIVALYRLDEAGGLTAIEAVQGNDAAVSGGAFWLPATRDADENGIPDVCEAPCPADLSGDGDVGFGDILEVIANWGPCGVPCPEDLSGNGQVDFADILAIIAAWGPC
ncbi:MAG: LamG domain-containing protein [Planctomycetes bacterium]|nr:LamG domain-containing protein [Planctomycetota bacterium]